MLDFFHVWVAGADINFLMKHPNLDAEWIIPAVSSNTFEIKSDEDIAIYNSLKFKIKNKSRVTIQGSLHKYCQNGTNHRDFSFSEMQSAIYSFCALFKIKPAQMRLRSFEFGVNLNLNASEYINSAIIHQTKRPTENFYNGEGHSKLFEHQQYDFKIYDKAQHSKHKNILRIERRFKKMASVQSLKIESFQDLLDRKKIERMKYLLLKPIKEIIFFEKIDTNSFKKKEADLCLSAQSPDFWHELSRTNREVFKYSQKKFNRLVLKNGKNIKENLIQEIEAKFNALMGSKIQPQKASKIQFPLEIIPQINLHFIFQKSPVHSPIYP